MCLCAQAQDPSKGEVLFKNNACASCHKIDTRLTGPALGPTITSETDEQYLIKWIQNNQALIAAKHPKALKIYNEYNQAPMNIYPHLSDEEVKHILAYVKDAWIKIQEAKSTVVAATPSDTATSKGVLFALVGALLITFVMILALNHVIETLQKLLLQKQTITPEIIDEAVEKQPVDRFATLKKLAKNKKPVFFLVLGLVSVLTLWQGHVLWNIGVAQDYQPIQPIQFSHELHAGTMKLECQYCHTGAFKSKSASIPSLNVCMNCHKAVKTESPEIQKIYDALGYDPQTQQYDPAKARPIAWVRIHNLPDLAYFNHAQHVKVGNIKCQTCHGPVETMKEVYQYAPLTMKWCIECHRKTEVDYKGNAYYDQLTQVHHQVKQGKKVTAAVLGGIECGKCHY